MSSQDFSPDPFADSYYDRLDVSPDASKRTIRRAGKSASNQYHPDSDNTEASNEAFLRIKKARETLRDSDNRKDYVVFCEILGDDVGTEAFEKWQQKDCPSYPSQWIDSNYDDELDKDSESDDESSENSSDDYNWSTGSSDNLQWESVADDEQDNDEDSETDSENTELEPLDERILENWREALDTPEIVSSNFDHEAANVYLNHWERGGKSRLYVNSFLKDDFYIDLYRGKVWTTEGEIPDIHINSSDDKSRIYINDGTRSIKVDLSGYPYKYDTERPSNWNRKDDSTGNGGNNRDQDTDNTDDDDDSELETDWEKNSSSDDDNADVSEKEMYWEKSSSDDDNADDSEKETNWEKTSSDDDTDSSGFDRLKFWKNSTDGKPSRSTASSMPENWIVRFILFWVWLALFPSPFDEITLRSVLLIAVAIPFPSFGPWALGVLFLLVLIDRFPEVVQVQVGIGFSLALAYALFIIAYRELVNNGTGWTFLHDLNKR